MCRPRLVAVSKAKKPAVTGSSPRRVTLILLSNDGDLLRGAALSKAVGGQWER